MKIQSHSPEQTQQIAADLVKNLKGGDTVALQGELGSGKTTFVQGLAKALGIKQVVNSPTFIIVQTYTVANHPTIKFLSHIDAYRLEKDDDARSAGLPEIIAQPDTLCLIEWPEKIPSLLPSNLTTVEFTHVDENTRLINIENSNV